MSADATVRQDARWVRAHAALLGAALDLAASSPIADVSLTRIAAHAGVSRSTAYEHASSARELLEEALLEELDGTRDRNLRDVGADAIAEATDAATNEVARHIDTHSEVYRIGLATDAGASSLAGMLAQHFADSTQMLLDAGDIDHGIPSKDADERRAIDALVVRGVAESAVGQFAAWIALPPPRDPALFTLVNTHLLPHWWPR